MKQSHPLRLGGLALVLALLLALPGLAAGRSSRGSLPDVVPAPFVYDRPLPETLPEAGWFSDALFIGDSRTTGLQEGGQLEVGLWLSQVGLNVRSARTDPFLVDGRRVALADLLKEKAFGKIYLCLGVNEAAWMGEAEFIREYAGFIDDLRRLVPGAQIYVQTIIPVTMSRAAARAPDNELLRRRNDLLAQLCRDKQVFLVDVAQAFTGANGALNQSLSSDGLHLNSSGNRLFGQYLTTHIFGT